ncbi:MAG: hypothetical protein J6K96_10715 [Treponema sp.]|nr:hypothetical protein [Treponema sp.]
MKKFAKLSAVLAAMVIALAFAGCSSDDDDDDKDDGMQAVTDTGASGTDASSMKDIDASEIGAGTYKYTSTERYEDNSYYITKGTVVIDGTRNSSTVIMTEKYMEEKYSNREEYEEHKNDFEKKADIEYDFDDKNFVLKVTYYDEGQEKINFSKFKEDYLDPENSEEFVDGDEIEDEWLKEDVYTNKSLKMSSDSSKVVCSCVCKVKWTNRESKETEIYKSKIEFVLERQ